MFASEASNFISDEKVIISSLVVILVTATVVSLVFQRLRLAIIPAYIVAGVIAGPAVLGFVQSAPALEEIAHLAVVLLLFGIGMELHLSSLKTGVARLLSASIGAISLTLLLLWFVGLLCGLNPVQSFTIAMALALSSTAVVLRILSLRRELGTSHGQLSLAVLVTQDLAALGMIALVPILATWNGTLIQNANSETPALLEIFQEAGLMIVGIFALLLVARKVIPFLLREALRDQSGELPMLAGVATALLTAYLSQMLGFSLEMGAFIAGFVLASSPFRFQLASRMSALRDLFMAIFFTTLGMELQLNVMLDHWALILAGTLGLLAIKTLGISVAALASGISARLAIRVGLALSQAGEFSLIILGQASDYQMFDEVTSSMIIAVVVLSLIFTPAILHLSPTIYSRFSTTWLAPWFSLPWQGEAHTDDRSKIKPPQVIVAGFGPLGRHLAAKLGQSGIRYTVVELNPDTVRKEQANNRPIVFGDISNDQILTNIDIRSVAILALTFPDPQVSIVAAALARATSKKLFIIARAPTGRDRQALIEAGADQVVVDEDASAGEMFSNITTASLSGNAA